MSITAHNLILPGAEYKPKDHAIFMETLTKRADGIISGCLLSKQSSNVIAVSAGYIVVHGRLIYVGGGTMTAQSTSTTTQYYLWCTLDLSNGGEPVFSIETTSTKDDTADFNLVNGTASLLLGMFSANSSGIVESSVKSIPIMKKASSTGLKTMKTIPATKVTMTNKDTPYKLGSITLAPGQYLIQAYAWISGVSGGTGTSRIQILRESGTDVSEQSLRTVCVQHSVNEKICIEAITWLTVPDTVGRNGTYTISLYSQSSYAGRSVAANEAGIGVCEIR